MQPITFVWNLQTHKLNNFYFSDQLRKYRTLRALKTMKGLPGFAKDFCQFVRDECRAEGDLILADKDPPLKDFNMDTLKNFSYEASLAKLENICPILMSSIAGSISDSKADMQSLSRFGFGGRRRGESVSLKPALVQTASAILHNRHPNSISTVPAINSLNNFTSQITSRYFYLSNALGTSFRSDTKHIPIIIAIRKLLV